MSPIKHSLNPQYSQGNIYAFNELEFDSPVWQKKLFPAFRFVSFFFFFLAFSMCCDLSETSASLQRYGRHVVLYKPIMNNKDEISYHIMRLKLIHHCLLPSSQKEGTISFPVTEWMFFSFSDVFMYTNFCRPKIFLYCYSTCNSIELKHKLPQLFHWAKSSQ